MDKNKQIVELAYEIVLDIDSMRIPLHNALLKCVRLSMLLDIPDNVKLFKERSTTTETNSIIVESYQARLLSAKDANMSVSSSNPNQYTINPIGNLMERQRVTDESTKAWGMVANIRSKTYEFVSSIYIKYQFWNLVEWIFAKKRKKIEPVLQKIFPDQEERLNSIENNLLSENSEDWKNAVTSCRTLIVDISNIIAPAGNSKDKEKYLNRLKSFVSPKKWSWESKTTSKLLTSLLEELKNRIEYTSDLTQWPSHTKRVTKENAENVVLYTYLIISDLLEVYHSRNPNLLKITEKENV